MFNVCRKVTFASTVPVRLGRLLLLSDWLLFLSGWYSGVYLCKAGLLVVINAGVEIVMVIAVGTNTVRHIL